LTTECANCCAKWGNGSLLERSQAKSPLFRGFPLMFLKYVILFDNADRDVQPDLYIPVAWDTVKEFFATQAKRLGQERLGL
jgi:hypothetical protein